MRKLIIWILKKMGLYHALRDCVLEKRHERELEEWESQGCPIPPPHKAKQNILKSYANQYNLNILVETGTYLGDMVNAMKGSFDRIYSIEYSHELYDQAKKRFRSVKNVELIRGDSGIEIGKLIKRMKEPALFWLDGHYIPGNSETAKGEKETPILEELEHILTCKKKGHVILIDDARCFGEDPAYPGIEQLKEFIHSQRDDVIVTIEDDCIRIVPKI